MSKFKTTLLIFGSAIFLGGCSLYGQATPIATPVAVGTSLETAGENPVVVASPTEVKADSTVTFKNGNFSPSDVKIKAGQTVAFTNGGMDDMWVASDPHPTHTDYPGFDALRLYKPGETYTFTFTKVGKWGYHNHRNPSQRGLVEVTN